MTPRGFRGKFPGTLAAFANFIPDNAPLKRLRGRQSEQRAEELSILADKAIQGTLQKYPAPARRLQAIALKPLANLCDVWRRKSVAYALSGQSDGSRGALNFL